LIVIWLFTAECTISLEQHKLTTIVWHFRHIQEAGGTG